MRTNQSLVFGAKSNIRTRVSVSATLPLGHVARLPSTLLSLAPHWNLHEMLLLFFFLCYGSFTFITSILSTSTVGSGDCSKLAMYWSLLPPVILSQAAEKGARNPPSD